MDPRYQAAAPDAFNAYLYAQHNAALNRNQELSVNAPEFIPLGEWSGHPHHPEAASQVFTAPSQVFNPNSRSFPPQHQQIQFGQQQPHQRPPRYVYQQNRNFGRHDLVQNHHHPGYSNQHQQQQHMYMMSQQGHQMGNNYHGGAGGHQQRGGIQNRLNFTPNAVESVPSEPMPHKQTETEQVALDYLSEVVSKLNDNPGLFENYQKRLREMFMELADNHFVMSNAIEIIFEQSINEQNFRYTGARLCLLLDTLDLSSNSTFRNLLVMKMEFQNTEQVPFMQNDQRRVRGTTLFLAELFVQLKTSENTRSTVDVARFVLNSILLLLTKPGPENIKCVCQTLKLSGYDLQKENPTEVEDAINQLRTIAEGQNIQTKRLIQSVVDLFHDNWGRKEAVDVENQIPSTSSLPDHLPQNYNDSPVFYGPDGQIITEEESMFLNANMPGNYPINIDDIIDDESDDLVEDEPEMDLEIQMAYKEFIKDGKRSNDAKHKE
ncbi:CLUMA_CG014225, isoform A [Clunio marinus]|uniref:CLUMA_CG014225, isoform A n=1 Tax=Clunio marinus TaxID=568069 RepID=A0A1J1ILN4_9DIPT|nr:CLUMA_CG014225, isoform A [Clunio marinus]